MIGFVFQKKAFLSGSLEDGYSKERLEREKWLEAIAFKFLAMET